MRVHYQTAIATLIQFIVINLLGIPNAIQSIISVCHQGGNNCVSNLIPTVAVYILTTGLFAGIWALGFVAQSKRSRLLCWMLIFTELLVMGAAVLDARHYDNLLGLLTSSLDILMAAWVILIALRLSRAKGGRVMKSGRHKIHTPTLND